MTRYLDTETVVAVNARQDGGVGVRDRAGVEAAVNRAASSFGGVDTFESLWQKAGAYLHGLASTQSFLDGNKRTA
ncbi:type II toxin-antitoxin system death-on-curing family toxin [Rhodococcoides kroppenstedtii]|uniref:type II toxin-antitoxin system death-on-curing family toxin n=1 Tax=Rhodococcoides kroppenstedtii TaxID=293050 RepID=UPI0028E3062D|nr:Fic family protein [Rhodococcus kroppenstedtii]